MPRRIAAVALFATALLGACGGPETSADGQRAVTDTPPTESTAEKSLTPDLDDLAGAYTVTAVIEPRIFSGENPGYSGDLLLAKFTCDAVRKAISYAVVVCAEGGTTQSPFILVIGDEYVERDESTTMTNVSLQYVVYRPVAGPGGVRAEVVMGATERREISMTEAVTLDLERVDSAAGRAIAVHHSYFGGSRTYNTIEMLGLNHFSSPQLVATFEGEGVAEFSDGKGFVYSAYHYADDEAMCCPSYVQANFFRPGPNGWTHSRLTEPNSPDKQMDEEPIFAGLGAVEIVATYEYPGGLGG